jgi:hypothetical protein
MIKVKDLEQNGTQWIYLTQDRDKTRAVVDTILNLMVPKNADILTKLILASCFLVLPFYTRSAVTDISLYDGKRQLGRPGIDGRIILKWMFRTGMWGGMD